MKQLPLRRQLEQRNMLGGSPSPNVAQTAVPQPSPAVTSDSATVIQSQQDFRRQQLKKRGFGSTYLAGDTGGYLPSTPTASPTSSLKLTDFTNKSLLGENNNYSVYLINPKGESPEQTGNLLVIYNKNNQSITRAGRTGRWWIP